MTLLDSAINQYKCCCGCMSVVTGTKVICALTLLECFFSAVAWAIAGGPFSGDITLSNIFLLLLVIFMICAGMASYGFAAALDPEASELGYEVRKWIKDLFKDYPLTKGDLGNIILFFGCVGFVCALLSSWFFSVIFKCFKYIRQIYSTGYDKMANPMNV
uniref:MARVEL domain-containing protein n=1 Tax=Panagrolaimus sp. PS1159 TaxID=55785 RepID=A0AC35G7H4_9BILA